MIDINLSSKGAPIAGQSLTNDPDQSYPWEKPAKFANPREALDSTTASSNTIVYVARFEAGDATGAVTEAGIFNAASSGSMLCRTKFNVVNKAADDTMNVTWTITLSAT